MDPGKIIDILTTPNGGVWALNDRGDVLERLVHDYDWRIQKNSTKNNVNGVRNLIVKPSDIFGIDPFHSIFRFRNGKWEPMGSDKMARLF